MEMIEGNKLEYLLEKAAVDPTFRPQFYDELLKSDLIVIYQREQNNGLTADAITLKKDTHVNIKYFTKKDGKPIIPVFFFFFALQRAITKEESYLKINAKSSGCFITPDFCPIFNFSEI